MIVSIARPLGFSFIITALLVMGGCGAASRSDDPELDEFDIIDTSGSDSATALDDEISIDPDEEAVGTNEGEFTLYWDVNTDDDYRLEIRLSESDDFNEGRELYSNFCDPDDDCHDEQNLSCEYQSNLEIVCEDVDDNESTLDVETVIDERDLPEDLFFILQVCDPFGFDCEDKSIEVEVRD